MSIPTIPYNNLPVYFQEYTVHILDGKDDQSKAGSVKYTTVGAIPSNVKNERVWTFNLTGTLKPNVKKYHIVYDFSKVDSELKVTFKDFVSGTFTICGNVLDATKLIKDNYTYSIEDAKVIIELDTSKWDFRLKRETLFSFDLNINDDTLIQILPNTSYDVKNNGNNILVIQESSIFTIPNIVHTEDAFTTPTIYYTLTCIDSKIFLNYEQYTIELNPKIPILVNGYNVVYKEVGKGCSAEVRMQVGTINFELCDFSLDLIPESNKISSGNSIYIEKGFNVYNYYTISRPTSDGSKIIDFYFIVMNINTNNYVIIGKFYQNVGPILCDVLGKYNATTGDYNLVDPTNKWWSFIKSGDYYYDTDKELGIIETFNIGKPTRFI